MTPLFLKLLTAHLLGDFIFQSNDLIQKKYKSWVGLFEHAAIITALSFLFVFPYVLNSEAWMVFGLIFLAHFIQDGLKIQYDIHHNKKKSTIPFFVDQILHVALLFILAPLLTHATPLKWPSWAAALYQSNLLALYLIGAILVTYVYDITLYQFQRKKIKLQKYKANFEKMAKRLLFFTVAFCLLAILMSSTFVKVNGARFFMG